jgi:hypothetical protein
LINALQVGIVILEAGKRSKIREGRQPIRDWFQDTLAKTFTMTETFMTETSHQVLRKSTRIRAANDERENSVDSYSGMSHAIEAKNACGDILEVEYYLGHSRTKRLLLDEIASVAKNIINTPEPQDDELSTTIPSLVDSPRVSVALFDYLLEHNGLPNEIGGCRCMYELDRYKVKVHIVQSGCHDTVAAVIGDEMAYWRATGGDRYSLISSGGGCTTLNFRGTNDSMDICPWLPKVCR